MYILKLLMKLFVACIMCLTDFQIPKCRRYLRFLAEIGFLVLYPFLLEKYVQPASTFPGENTVSASVLQPRLWNTLRCARSSYQGLFAFLLLHFAPLPFERLH